MTAALIAVTLIAAPRAQAQSAYVKSARSLVHAELRLWQTEHANLGAGHAALSAFVSQVSAGCPRALSGARNTQATSDVAFEIGQDLVLATRYPDRAALLTYSSSLMQLRSGDPKLQTSINGLARARRLEANIYEPAAVLCSHIRALRASNFQTTASATAQFLAGVATFVGLIREAETGLSLSLLPPDHRVNNHARALEQRVDKAQQEQARSVAASVSTALGASG